MSAGWAAAPRAAACCRHPPPPPPLLLLHTERGLVTGVVCHLQMGDPAPGFDAAAVSSLSLLPGSSCLTDRSACA